MASTNHTANLNLCQWAAADPVLREDFNADNAAIDAAMGGIPCRKLREVSTTQTSFALEFDLSDIDLNEYSALRFVLLLKVNGQSNYYPTTKLYFNSAVEESATTMCYMRWGSTDLYSSYTGLSAYVGEHSTDSPAVWQLDLTVGTPSANSYRNYSGTFRGSVFCGGSMSFWNTCFGLYTDRLSKLILSREGASNYGCRPFDAGTKIIIYGVKK